jgi:two-component system, sensor histidine kinase and response regulator
MTQQEQPSVMVVDDQPANLKLLEDMLKLQGYGVRSFPRGRLALAAAAQKAPDLILLDINMPEMNGFEVCERLKSSPKLARIPVIFLSALNATEDKVKAFRSGGVDYVTKPFQLEEVQSRVETHLGLRRLQRALEEHADHLEELVRSRTRELAAAHTRLKILDQSKSDFLNLISHEFRTPLNGLLGVSELLLDDTEDNELRGLFDQSRRRMLTILDHALLLTQIEVEGEKFASESVPLTVVLGAALEQASEFARDRQVLLESVPPVPAIVLGKEDLLVKAFQALLETAVKFSQAGETVRLASHSVSDAIHVEIDSRGRTIPVEALPTFFDLFSIGEAITPGGDLGLDPPLARRVLSLFGGSVTVENRQQPSGIHMTVSLRLVRNPQATDAQPKQPLLVAPELKPA